ncbi:MAG: hypothetical protein PHU63_00115 [Candidatus ainarchaeum sp.]|nr:hypothetical protein [Candidatus ainarchaeum sp.]
MKNNSNWKLELARSIRAEEIITKFPELMKHKKIDKHQIKQINCSYPVGITRHYASLITGIIMTIH